MKRFLTYTLCAVTLTAAAVDSHRLEAMTMTLEQWNKKIDGSIQESIQITLNKDAIKDPVTLKSRFYSSVYAIFFQLGKSVELFTKNDDFNVIIKKLDKFLIEIQKAKASVFFPIITTFISYFELQLKDKAKKFNDIAWTPNEITKWAQQWTNDMQTTADELKKQEEPKKEDNDSIKDVKQDEPKKEDNEMSIENIENLNNENSDTSDDVVKDLNVIKNKNKNDGLENIREAVQKAINKNKAKMYADLCVEAVQKKAIEKIVINTNELNTAWEKVQPEDNDSFGFIYGDSKNPLIEKNTESFKEFVNQLHITITVFYNAIDKNLANNDHVKKCSILIDEINDALPNMLKTWFDEKATEIENNTNNIKTTAEEIMKLLTSKDAIFSLDEKDKECFYYKTINKISKSLNT